MVTATNAAATPQTPGATAPRYNVPAGRLSDIIRTIRSEGDQPILTSLVDLGAHHGNRVAASSELDAITQALAGSDLIVTHEQAGYVISYRSRGDADRMDVIALRNEAETAYKVDQSSSSTRTGGDMRDLPQSNTTVTAKLIGDEQIQTIAQSIQNVSGSTVNLGNVQGAASYTVRGFVVTPLSNGLTDPGGIAQPVANVERVDVLKGPAAILSGPDNLGGVINIVTKKPTANPLLNVSVEDASYGDRKIDVDGSTALNADKTISARIVGEYDDADTNFGGYDGRSEYTIAPSIRFKNADLDVTAGVEASDALQPAQPYAFFNATGQLVHLGDTPIGPSNQGINISNQRTYYDATYRVADWLTLVSRTQDSRGTQNLHIWAAAAALNDRTELFLKTTDRQRTVTDATDDYARLNFTTIGIRQTMSVGMNYSRYVDKEYSPSDPDEEDVDVLTYPRNSYALQNFFPTNEYISKLVVQQVGIYGQDLLEHGPVHVLAGVRSTNNTSDSFIVQSNDRATGRQTAITPNAGIVLDLSRQLSAYFSFVKGFAPNYYLGVNNEPLAPTRSTNFETGMKAQLFRKRLNITASLYRLQESNHIIAATGYYDRFEALPGLESNGFEVDVDGTILPGWMIAASYTYADYEYLRPELIGLVTGQPRQKGSLFTRYTIQSGALANLGAAIGVYGFSASNTAMTPGDRLPTQISLNLNVYYRIGKLGFNFGITNLLNHTLYNVATNASYVPLQGPRMFRGTMSYSFF